MRPLSLLLALLLFAPCSYAQQSGQFGVNVGIVQTTPTVGATIHLNPRWALRSTLSFESTTTTTELPVTIPGMSSDEVDIDNRTLGAGVGLLYFLSPDSPVLPYLGITGRYLRTEGDQVNLDIQFGNPTVAIDEVTSDRFAFSARLGAQYRPTERFALFGEVGFGATLGDGSTTTSTLSAGTTTSQTRIGFVNAGTGLIFYLN